MSKINQLGAARNLVVFFSCQSRRKQDLKILVGGPWQKYKLLKQIDSTQ